MTEKVLNLIKELKEKSKSRNFVQTFDLIIILKEFDIKKSENKFSEDIILPNGRGKEARIVVFSDSIKDLDCDIFNTEDIQNMAKNKRETKKLVKNTDFFFAEAKMMPLIGKAFGQFLAPRGKMPKIVAGDAKKVVENIRKSVRIRIKDSPVIQCMVGNEKMGDKEVSENIETVLKFLENKLPKGKHNIDKFLIKLTMGKPMRVEL